MRYDIPIFFQRIQPGAYNATTHNYSEDTITEEKQYASVTDTGEETLKLVYNTVKQGSLTIRLQRAYTKPFDKIRIDGKVYRVDLSRKKKTFVVSEVQ